VTRLASGEVVWVTGASQGIGRALALRLSREGMTVAASARGREGLDRLQAEAPGPGAIRPYPLDVTDGEATARVVERVESEQGPIAQAVLNAGTHRPTPASNLRTEDFEALVEVNLLGTVKGLTALLPAMRSRRRGGIAVVASLAGYAGLPNAAAYSMTKGGLIRLCEALRPELAAEGIRLQVINPGFVRTPLTDRNDFPMPFLIEPEEAADAIWRGLASGRFEIAFPWRLVAAMRLLRALPYGPFFAVTRRMVRR